MTVAVCLKWVDRRPEVDPLTGAVAEDPRTSGPSDADLAALEIGLRLADARGESVLVVTAGPAAAEAMLRDALAVGAAGAVRVDLVADAPSDVVASGLARACGDASVVVCGDYSIDRGSGSVPAYLAGALGAAQALGLVEVATDGDTLVATRRLDAGRRERLRVPTPAVLSVEGIARLRRADVAASLAARTATIEVVAGPAHAPLVEPERAPYRPRPRELPAPAGDSALARTLALTGTAATGEAKVREEVVLDPIAAADKIEEQLRAWGYRD